MSQSLSISWVATWALSQKQKVYYWIQLGGREGWGCRQGGVGVGLLDLIFSEKKMKI